MKCPKCSCAILSGEAVCAFCQYVLPLPGKPQTSAPKEARVSSSNPIECPACGTLNRAGSVSCSMCNLMLVKVQEPAPAAKPEPQPAPQQREPDSTQALDCPSCGEMNLPDVSACRGCGRLFAAAAAPKPEPEAKPEIPPSDEPIDCPSCGTTNKPGSKFCDMCNINLSAKSSAAKPAVQESVPLPDILIEELVAAQPEPPPKPKPEPKPEPIPEPAAQPPSQPKRKELPPEKRIPFGRFPQKIPFTTPPADIATDCPNCRASNTPGSEYCSMCNFLLAPVADRPKVEPEKIQAAPPPKEKPELTLEKPPEKAAAAQPPPAPAASKKVRKTRPFILIVGDDYHERDALTAFLEGKGAPWVSDSGDSQDAMMQAQSLSVEIVLLEMKFEGATGLGLYQKFRASQFMDKEMCVLFIVTPEDADKVPSDDPHVSFITRPLDNESLWKKVQGMTDNAFS